MSGPICQMSDQKEDLKGHYFQHCNTDGTCPLSPYKVDVHVFKCKNQPVNATLMGGRRRGMLLIALMCFTCCSSEVLQLFMTKVVGMHILYGETAG